VKMHGGWVGRMCFVDLTSEKMWHEETTKYALQYIGGRGIAARIAWELLPAGTDAFDPENVLLILTGPLTGTLAPTSGRTVFAGVSPRVYPRPWYTHSTMGGFFGPELKYSGFDGLVIKGRSPGPSYILVRNGEVELLGAEDLWGLGTHSTERRMKEKHGSRAQVISIGPAGEKLVRFAAIVSHSPEAASGHSGFGAVMGSKNLKAVVAIGDSGVKVADRSGFMAACRRAMKLSRGGMVSSIVKRRGEDSDGGAKLSRPICTHACNARCELGRTYRKVARRFSPGVIERQDLFCVGTIWAEGEEAGFGCGVDMPSVSGWKPEEGGVELHEVCDDLGLDLWVLLTIQPWLVKCIESDVGEICGRELRPRDASWFYELLQDIAHRRGIGDLLAEDLRRAVEKIKHTLPASVVEAAEVLEFAFGFPSHREGRVWDHEPLPFWAVSAIMYATESRDPTIGTHSYLQIADIYMHDRSIALEKLRPLAKLVWGSEEAIEPSFGNKANVAIWCQNRHVLIDSLPLCDFVFPSIIRPFDDENSWRNAIDVAGDLDIEAELLSTCTGLEIESSELDVMAERIFNLERVLLARFGRDRSVDEKVAKHFELPCESDGTRVDKETFRKMMDEYYAIRGWDRISGMPSRSLLVKLGLEDVADSIAHP